jgi:hypothetical protein
MRSAGMRSNICIPVFLSSLALFGFLSCQTENLQGELLVENNSSYQTVEIYIALEDSQDWGENLLDTPIDPGDTWSISSLPRAEIKVKTVSLISGVPSENIYPSLDLLLNSKVTLTLTD